ncbi:MAG: hypothetical protein FWE24_11675 [Defluviitaleaceae bacterium]|nr:hypothetical protein [Defluviitaleaceae bacterium]
MDNNKDDLRVEHYDKKELESKKRIILKRVAIAVAITGAIMLLVGVMFALADFGAAATFPLGGSGSWYISVLEPA